MTLIRARDKRSQIRKIARSLIACRDTNAAECKNMSDQEVEGGKKERPGIILQLAVPLMWAGNSATTATSVCQLPANRPGQPRPQMP